MNTRAFEPRLACLDPRNWKTSRPANGSHSELGMVMGVALAGLFAAGCQSAELQTPRASVEEASVRADVPWTPSEWGTEDQRGAMNRLGPSNVVAASLLIKRGKVYSLGRLYEPGIPLFGQRHYSLTIPGSPTGGPMGANNLVYHDEMFSGEIGQIGTQLDGLGHIGTRVDGKDVFYNGFTRTEIGTPYGLAKLGIEKVGVFFTRAVLIDVAGFKGVERMKSGEIITVRDFEETLKKQSVQIREGDAVFIRTGHGKLWKVDNETYNEGEPGPGLTALRWLAAKKIVLVGADNWGVEAVPGENPDNAFEGHQLLLSQNGIYLLENLDLDELAADKAYEFAFVFAPVPLKGATGSPGNPIAVR